MSAIRWLALAAALAVAAGCGFDEPAAPLEPEDATGRWEAFVDGTILDLQLIEWPDMTITGVGHLRPAIVLADGSVAFRAEGVSLFPRVSMTLRSFGLLDINFTGRWLGPQSIRGRLFGGGFEGERAVLRRRDLRVDTSTVVITFEEMEEAAAGDR